MKQLKDWHKERKGVDTKRPPIERWSAAISEALDIIDVAKPHYPPLKKLKELMGRFGVVCVYALELEEKTTKYLVIRAGLEDRIVELEEFIVGEARAGADSYVGPIREIKKRKGE